MSELNHTDYNCTYSQTGATPLFWAAQEGYIQIAEMLLNAGASVDLADEVRFRFCKYKYLECVLFSMIS